jgi:hypothetical protein
MVLRTGDPARARMRRRMRVVKQVNAAAAISVPRHRLVFSQLSRQMARDAAMVGARCARIGVFAEAIAAIAADCGCVWRRSFDL